MQNPLPASRLDALLDAGVPPVVVLAGNEAWFREDGLARIVRALLPEGDSGHAFLRYDAKRPEDREGVSAAIDELHSRGLFGGGKVVAIDNPESAGGPWATGGRLSPITRLARAALENPAPQTCLVLLTTRGVKGRDAAPVKTLVKDGAQVVDCRALYDAPGPWQRGAAPDDHELARHVMHRLRTVHGKRITRLDAHALTRLVGGGLSDLEDALRSLALYVGREDAVTSDAVHAVVAPTRTDPGYALVDAVFDRDLPRALDLLEQATARGLAASGSGSSVRGPEALFGYLSTSLHGEYRKVLAGAEALARGDDPQAVARELGVPPFKTETFVRHCRHDPAEVLERHAAFLEAEAGVKSGRVPAGLALERLVVALAR